MFRLEYAYVYMMHEGFYSIKGASMFCVVASACSRQSHKGSG